MTQQTLQEKTHVHKDKDSRHTHIQIIQSRVLVTEDHVGLHMISYDLINLGRQF